jgi:hypothetical protein
MFELQQDGAMGVLGVGNGEWAFGLLHVVAGGGAIASNLDGIYLLQPGSPGSPPLK